MSNIYQLNNYIVRRKVFKILGGAFHIYDAAGNVVAYSKQKAFKLKEDIRLFTDDSMSQELLMIQSRAIIDFGASYDVFDPHAGVKVGAFRRKGWKSAMLRDEWLILDPYDRQVGTIQEEGKIKALLRRYIEAASIFLPQRYNIEMMGQPIATARQNRNPFVYKLELDLSRDTQYALDRRMAVAMGLLLAAVEGKQGG